VWLLWLLERDDRHLGGVLADVPLDAPALSPLNLLQPLLDLLEISGLVAHRHTSSPIVWFAYILDGK
jgi:hypothetical protein